MAESYLQRSALDVMDNKKISPCFLYSAKLILLMKLYKVQALNGSQALRLVSLTPCIDSFGVLALEKLKQLFSFTL